MTIFRSSKLNCKIRSSSKVNRLKPNQSICLTTNANTWLESRRSPRAYQLGQRLTSRAYRISFGQPRQQASINSLFEFASDWERLCLLKYDGEGWIELYRHLLMLRSKLTFDQLVGFNIQYGEDQSPVQTIPGCSGWASALCSNQR